MAANSSNRNPKHDHASPGYLLYILGLSVLALGMLTFETLGSMEPGTRTIFNTMDYVICLLFLADFAICFSRAENKKKYFFTWGWIDLLSSIPSINALRLGRLARAFRIFKILRTIRAAKILADFILDHREKNTFLAALLTSIILLGTCAIAVLHVESGSGGNINTAQDALWWAIATITTVGYGDKIPLTPEGQVIAALLMLVGVGMFGTFSGFIAAWFIAPKREADENDLKSLRKEIRELREALTMALARIQPSGAEDGKGAQT